MDYREKGRGVFPSFCSSNKYFSSSCYSGPASVLGTWDTDVNKTESLPSWSIHSLQFPRERSP